MAHYEKHMELTCHPLVNKETGSRRWRGQAIFHDMINQQKIQKLVVLPKDCPAEEPQTGWPRFTVTVYSSARSADVQPYPDDDLYMVMPPQPSREGRLRWFDIAGYAFQDRDVPLTEVFGKMRVVVELEDSGNRGPDDQPVFLVAIGGDVPGATTHGASVFLA